LRNVKLPSAAVIARAIMKSEMPRRSLGLSVIVPRPNGVLLASSIRPESVAVFAGTS